MLNKLSLPKSVVGRTGNEAGAMIFLPLFLPLIILIINKLYKYSIEKFFYITRLQIY